MDFTPGDPPVFGTPKPLFDLHTTDLEGVELHRWPDQQRFLATHGSRRGRAKLVTLENRRPR